MEIWIAAGDETGDWDIVDGRFGSEYSGVAWVLGSLSSWDKALRMPHGGMSALEAFSRPIAERLPSSVTLPAKSTKYHVLDVWKYTASAKLAREVTLDSVNVNPVLELLRGDAAWLLGESGLGTLAVGGSAADGKAAGLGVSGDGLRERARAFAGLLSVALPFIPGDTSLNLLAEGRLESVIADAARFNRFSDGNHNKYVEPYRSFVGYLTEDLARIAKSSLPAVADGIVVNRFICKGKGPLRRFIEEQARGVPLLKANAEAAVLAMNGIADLAAALVPRPAGVGGCRLVVPVEMAGNLWAGNFKELRRAIHF